MNTTNDGGPAFPQPHDPHGNDKRVKDGNVYLVTAGMSLRDWFAGKALAGLMASPSTNPEASEDNLAYAAYRQADAMLAERSKESPTT